jgi:hypothetical protein
LEVTFCHLNQTKPPHWSTCIAKANNNLTFEMAIKAVLVEEAKASSNKSVTDKPLHCFEGVRLSRAGEAINLKNLYTFEKPLQPVALQHTDISICFVSQKASNNNSRYDCE